MISASVTVNPQQVFNAVEAAASTSAYRTTKTEQGSMPAPEAAQAGSMSPGAIDQAEMSAAAGAMAQALTGSDVRTGTVAALQQSISAGTYSVSSSDVAEKLIGAMMQ